MLSDLIYLWPSFSTSRLMLDSDNSSDPVESEPEVDRRKASDAAPKESDVARPAGRGHSRFVSDKTVERRRNPVRTSVVEQSTYSR